MTPVRSVRFGLSLPNRAVLFGLPVERVLEAAEAAERSAFFDSVWVGDNLLSRPRLESIVILSAIAARTRRVKLGTICLASFPMRHPVALAIQWASLDVLSGGRTILAVSIGGSANRNALTAAELATMGVASTDRVGRMREGIEILRRAWSSDPLEFHGKFFDLGPIEVLPKPVQPRIPIIIAVNPQKDADAATEERALRRVARIADGWQSDETPPSLFAERWRRIRAYAEEYGRSELVTDASYHLMMNINDDADAAFHESGDFLDHYYGAGRFKSDDVRRSWLAFGPPDRVVEKINAFLDAGCTTPVVRFTALDQVGQLERFLRDVAPAFVEARTATPA